MSEIAMPSLVLFLDLFLCALVVNDCFGFQVFLEVNPPTIHTILTKKLRMRCSLKNDVNLEMQKPLSKEEFCDRTTPSCNTKAEELSLKVASTSTSPRSDISDLLSIVITKYSNDHKKREIIASVTSAAAPKTEAVFTSAVQAEGTCESSDVDELGYLLLTMDMPTDEHAGNYTCEVLALDFQKIPLALNASFSIAVIQPSVSDLVTYISKHEQEIIELRKQVSDLKETNITLMRHISERDKSLQTGRSTICRDNPKNYIATITFQQPYVDTPKIFAKVTKWTYPNGRQFLKDLHQPLIVFESASLKSFSTLCYIGDQYLIEEFEWLAVI
ncbi:unnamed protein product [Lymnaea stagnalis]|uniref:Uncharacterized protein n=1 Tax=Lymnaea stagnalis TaxID=6523 RepID=A0AAV2IPA1_LYMST